LIFNCDLLVFVHFTEFAPTTKAQIARNTRFLSEITGKNLAKKPNGGILHRFFEGSFGPDLQVL